MKELEIKLPTSISQCTPDQMAKWLMMAEAMKDQKDDITQFLIFQCQLLSLFSGESINRIKRADVNSIQAASAHMLQILTSYNYQEPNEIIEIEGKQFRFEKNFGHVSTGQIIDLKLIEDISQDPCQALAIMYVEKGMEYCQEDDRGRVLNPNEDRYKLFKEHFPGDEFLNFFSFIKFNFKHQPSNLSQVICYLSQHLISYDIVSDSLWLQSSLLDVGCNSICM